MFCRSKRDRFTAAAAFPKLAKTVLSTSVPVQVMRWAKSRRRRRFQLLGAVLASIALWAPSNAPHAAATSGLSFATGAIVVAGPQTRLLHPDGTLDRVLSFSAAYSGVIFDSTGRLFAIGPRPVVYSLHDDNSLGWFGNFPDGFSTTAIANGGPDRIYVAISDDRFLNEIYRFDRQGRTPAPVLVRAKVTAMDVGSDGCTVVYATPAAGLKRLDWCTSARLPDFAARVAATAVRALPDGTVLAATAGSQIVRLSEGGSVVASYEAPGEKYWSAFDLTPDGSSFWAGTLDDKLYRFDLATGAVLQGPIAVSQQIRAVAVQGAPRGNVPRGSGPPPPEGVSLDGVSGLTGEGLASVGFGSEAAPSCAPGITAETKLESSRLAIGPYDGTFTGAADAVIGPQTIARPSGLLGLSPGAATELQGTFSIQAGAVTIMGVLSLPPGGGSDNTGACRVFQDQTFPSAVAFPPDYPLSGYYRNIYGKSLRYRAEISVAGRAYVDAGVSELFADEYNLTDSSGHLAGNGKRWSQSFVSDNVSTNDAFTAKGQHATHAAGITSTTKGLTVLIRWKSAHDRFSVRNIALRAPSRSLQNHSKLKPGKLKITIIRTPISVKVKIENLSPGRVAFQVVADAVASRTSVATSLSGR